MSWIPNTNDISFVMNENGNDEFVRQNLSLPYTSPFPSTTYIQSFPYGAIVQCPSWSASGNRVVWRLKSAGTNPRWDIYYKQLPTYNQPIRITDNFSIETCPLWRGSTDEIIFTSNVNNNQYDIYKHNVVTNQTVRLTTDAFSESNLSLSPDGNKLIFARLTTGAADVEFFLYDLVTNTITQLTDNDDWEHSPVWSADNNRFAYYSGRLGSEGIYIMNIAQPSTAYRLAGSHISDRNPSWSSDSTWILVESSRSQSYDLYALGINPSRVRRITSSSAYETNARWSLLAQSIAPTPTLRPTVTSTQTTCTVDMNSTGEGTGGNMRVGPNSSAAIITAIPWGTLDLPVINGSPASGAIEWVQVVFQSQVGWISNFVYTASSLTCDPRLLPPTVTPTFTPTFTPSPTPSATPTPPAPPTTWPSGNGTVPIYPDNLIPVNLNADYSGVCVPRITSATSLRRCAYERITYLTLSGMNVNWGNIPALYLYWEANSILDPLGDGNLYDGVGDVIVNIQPAYEYLLGVSGTVIRTGLLNIGVCVDRIGSDFVVTTDSCRTLKNNVLYAAVQLFFNTCSGRADGSRAFCSEETFMRVLIDSEGFRNWNYQGDSVSNMGIYLNRYRSYAVDLMNLFMTNQLTYQECPCGWQNDLTPETYSYGDPVITRLTYNYIIYNSINATRYGPFFEVF